jgi:ribonuclease BN (tRNA processing enzyme)
VELIVLGTDSGFPRPGGACSGYLVRHEGFNLVVDLGTGALANLQHHVPHDGRIDAIVLSHEHPDHCLDLYPLYVARWLHPEPLPSIPVYGPAGAFERVARLEGTDGSPSMPAVFEPHTVEPGERVEVGPFRIDTRPMAHLVTNLGVRIQADGTSMVYTGDTGPSEELVELARGVDVLLAEATLLDGPDPSWFHLSARQAAEHGTRAGVGTLVLTHFWPTRDRDLSRQQAGEAFDGTVVMAEEGLSLAVGS